MSDAKKTTKELIQELAEARTRIAELEASEAKRKQAEKALWESEEKHRAILGNIEEGYYEVDLAGNLTLFNDALCRLYGYAKDELMGMNYRQYVDDETVKIMYQTYNAVYRTGKPDKAFDWEVVRKDGTRRFVEVSISLMSDSTGEPTGFRGIVRDITERKRAEEQLQRYAAELERSNEDIKQFAYIVSHDLRAPLVNLKGFSAELRAVLAVLGSAVLTALPLLDERQRQTVVTALEEDVPEALDFIDSSVTRMDRLINAVLRLSRLGRRELKIEPIDMNALLQTTLQTLAHQLEEHQVEVTMTLAQSAC